MKGITHRQAQVLAFVSAYRVKHNCGPTVREVRDHLGVSAIHGAEMHLVALRKKGLVTWTPREHRTIRLTQEVKA